MSIFDWASLFLFGTAFMGLFTDSTDSSILIRVAIMMCVAIYLKLWSISLKINNNKDVEYTKNKFYGNGYTDGWKDCCNKYNINNN